MAIITSLLDCDLYKFKMLDLEKCIAEIEFRFPCVRDHKFTSKEWQTLKSAVLAQQTTNTASPKFPTLEECLEEFEVNHPLFFDGKRATHRYVSRVYDFICRKLSGVA